MEAGMSTPAPILCDVCGAPARAQKASAKAITCSDQCSQVARYRRKHGLPVKGAITPRLRRDALCEAKGCRRASRDGKPYCIEHVLMHDYAAQVAEKFKRLGGKADEGVSEEEAARLLGGEE
jgi:hypothetical protein